MKKLLTIFAFLGVMAFGASKTYAQTQDSTQAATEEVAPAETATSDESAVAEEELSFHQGIKEKFIEESKDARITRPLPDEEWR